jgi:hypothetical protein
MAKDAKILCPLMGCECIEDGSIKDNELVKCRFWINVQGTSPQTGEVVNHYDCSMAWMPVLMIENSKVNRETGAAVESFRNEMVKTNDMNTQILLETASSQTNVKLIKDIQ